MNCDFIESIENVLEKKDEKGTSRELALRILDFEMASAEPENAGCQRGLSKKNHGVARVAKACKKDSGFYNQALADITAERVKHYETRKFSWNHRRRRQYLEDTIRILQPIETETEDPRFLSLLARIYLYRGLLYRPKGRTTPARKLEAIQKSLRLSETAAEKFPEAWRVWSAAALELKRADESSFKIPAKQLKDAASHIHSHGISDLNDILTLLECGQDDRFSKTISEWSDEKNWGRPYDLFLAKAKNAFQNNHKDMETYLKHAIDHAPKAFSNPFWDDLVDLLKALRASGFDVWKKMSLLAHAECRKREARITSNIVLRWYWARQKDLYDLAFLAEKDPGKKAKIADSLKSRPVLRYQALNELGNDKQIKAILDQEDEARDGRYMKQKPSSKEKKVIQEMERRRPVDFSKIPEPWVAVHFYLNDLEEKGYALIFRSQDKEWTEYQFDYRELHRKFVAWQEVYFSEKENAADSLVAICREIGNTMKFMFDGALPEGSRILWIPHGFLHRLPLHAALCNDGSNRIFLEDHVSSYLPSWNILTDTKHSKGIGEYLIKRLRTENEDKSFSELNGKEWISKRATDLALKEVIKTNPRILTILCHGHGEILNPFKSWLELKDSRINVLDILKSEAELSGTSVLLGACESDLAPPTEHTIDEHLSLSTVFLSHQAREVLAGLWEVNNKKVDGCYSEVFGKPDISETLRTWQQKDAGFWKKNLRNKLFYNMAPFRIMGFPEIDR